MRLIDPPRRDALTDARTGMHGRFITRSHRVLTGRLDSRYMTRTERQRTIERLLCRIRDDVAELERLRARGVRGRPLAERQDELSHARDQLAQVVARAGDDARTSISSGDSDVRSVRSGRSSRSIAHSNTIVTSS
jgi:hypothetical protein